MMKIYEARLINKVNFTREVGNRKHCLQLHLFFFFFLRASVAMNPFMALKIVSMTFFTDN